MHSGSRLARWTILLTTPLALYSGVALFGAADGVAGPLFAAILLLVLALNIALTPHLREAFAGLATPMLLAVAFGLYVALSALAPLPAPFAHPVWQGPGPISMAPHRSLEALSVFAGIIAAFGLGRLAIAHFSGKWVFTIVAGFGIFYGLAALIEHVAHFNFREPRLNGLMPSGNAAATLFAAHALVGCALLAQAWSAAPRGLGFMRRGWEAVLAAPIAAACTSVCLVCLALTASRAGLASFGLALTLLAIGLIFARSGVRAGLRPAIFTFAALATLFLVAAIGFFLTGLGELPQRLDQAGLQQDAAERWRALQFALGQIVERPVFGHGLGTFIELREHAADPATYAEFRSLGALHNAPLQLLMETGLIGLVLALGLTAWLVWRALTMRDGNVFWGVLALALMAQALTHSLLDIALNVPAILALLAFMLAAATAQAEPSGGDSHYGALHDASRSRRRAHRAPAA